MNATRILKADRGPITLDDLAPFHRMRMTAIAEDGQRVHGEYVDSWRISTGREVAQLSGGTFMCDAVRKVVIL